MKFMKKLIFSALAAFLYFLYALFPLAAPVPAQADESASSGEYACILGDSTFFYTAKDETKGLFLLPKTYFVKVLETSPDYCKIEYLYDDANVKKLVGYARTSELTFVDYTPQRPYLYRLFEVRYRLEDSFSDDSSFLSEITVTCAYYGDYRIGSKTYCYILRGDSFGYIPKPADLTYDENTEYEERLSQNVSGETTDSTDDEEQSGSTSPAQIAILSALCLLVPVLAALILKPPRRPPYEQED